MKCPNCDEQAIWFCLICGTEYCEKHKAEHDIKFEYATPPKWKPCISTGTVENVTNKEPSK